MTYTNDDTEDVMENALFFNLVIYLVTIPVANVIVAVVSIIYYNCHMRIEESKKKLQKKPIEMQDSKLVALRTLHQKKK